MIHKNESIISIKSLEKTYSNGFHALKNLNLEIMKGEIFGLLGPNGAGKTTMISIIAGLTHKSSGSVTVKGKDNITDYQFTRRIIGLVPQEINSDSFFTVEESITMQAGFFGIAHPEQHVEKILKDLSLWDKRKSRGMQLSGGMKRRVMIAKALVHDPEILFLDEPSAGVDVELRTNLWQLIRNLKAMGKTIILTTHYLEEAEDLADRVGIINRGELILLETKKELLETHGAKLHDIYLKLVAESNQNSQ